jgi:hypothetical protein
MNSGVNVAHSIAATTVVVSLAPQARTAPKKIAAMFDLQPLCFTLINNIVELSDFAPCCAEKTWSGKACGRHLPQPWLETQTEAIKPKTTGVV